MINEQKIYFHSDWHLAHKNILTLCNRRFTSIEEHDEYIIKCINETCTKADRLIILGDLGYHKDLDGLRNALKRLNVRPEIVLGNHDHMQHLVQLKREGVIADVKEFKTIQKGSKHIVCCHYPLKEWNGYYRGYYHCFGHCIDDETEVLTKDGFKFFNQITKDDIILNLNIEKDCIEEDIIKNIISYNYTGNVYHLKCMGTDLRVTDKHRMLSKTVDRKKYKFMTADDYAMGGTRYVIRAGQYNQKGLDLSDDMLRLLVWISADGNRCNTDLIRLRLLKERKIQRFNELLDRLNIEHRNLLSKGFTSINFTLPKELCDYRFKPIDDRILLCNRHQAEVIREEYSHTDGRYTSDRTVTIYSSKKHEVEILQRMFILNNFGTILSTRYNHGFSLQNGETKVCYELAIHDKNIRTVGDVTKRMKKEYVNNEHFWCLETNNGTLIVRRNGYVCITGNCHGTLPQYDRCLDVGVDNIGYYPMEFDDVIKTIDKGNLHGRISKEDEMINEFFPNLSTHYFVGLCTGHPKIRQAITEVLEEGSKGYNKD